MLEVPDFGRRPYFALLAALAAAGLCAWALALVVLRPGVTFALAWGVMIAAALLPSSAPMVATYTSLRHAAAGTQRAWSGAAAFVGGYLAVWWATGALADLFARAPDPGAADRYVDAAVLALAGAYELTPLKRRCLATCRVPLAFLLTSWRDGAAGALDMGARYGLRCVGACIGLVAAFLAVEPRALEALAAVATVVALHKLAPGRTVLIRLTALGLFGGAIAVLAGG